MHDDIHTVGDEALATIDEHDHDALALTVCAGEEEALSRGYPTLAVHLAVLGELIVALDQDVTLVAADPEQRNLWDSWLR